MNKLIKQLSGILVISGSLGAILDLSAAAEKFGMYLIVPLFIAFVVGSLVPKRVFENIAPEWFQWKWNGLLSVLAVTIILLFIAQKSSETQSGIIAEFVPVVKDFQQRLGLLDQKLDVVIEGQKVISDKLDSQIDSMPIYENNTMNEQALMSNVSISIAKRDYITAKKDMEILFDNLPFIGIDSAIVYKNIINHLGINPSFLKEQASKYKSPSLMIAYVTCLDNEEKVKFLASNYKVYQKEPVVNFSIQTLTVNNLSFEDSIYRSGIYKKALVFIRNFNESDIDKMYNGFDLGLNDMWFSSMVFKQHFQHSEHYLKTLKLKYTQIPK